MQSFSSKDKKYIIRKYCMMSFKITVYLYSEQQVNDFETIIQRLKSEEKMKMYDVCCWLKGRRIEYSLSFKYNWLKSIKWNIIKYRNYLRLRIRLKEIE